MPTLLLWRTVLLGAIASAQASLKLAVDSATVGSLRYERANTPGHDPVRRFAREQASIGMQAAVAASELNTDQAEQTPRQAQVCHRPALRPGKTWRAQDLCACANWPHVARGAIADERADARPSTGLILQSKNGDI